MKTLTWTVKRIHNFPFPHLVADPPRAARDVQHAHLVPPVEEARGQLVRDDCWAAVHARVQVLARNARIETLKASYLKNHLY